MQRLTKLVDFRRLDRVFQGQYLPCLDTNYKNKDLGNKYIKQIHKQRFGKITTTVVLDKDEFFYRDNNNNNNNNNNKKISLLVHS